MGVSGDEIEPSELLALCDGGDWLDSMLVMAGLGGTPE